jgi:hypothetical protein
MTNDDAEKDRIIIKLSHQVQQIRQWLDHVKRVNGSIVANSDNPTQVLLAMTRESLAEVGLKTLGEEHD